MALTHELAETVAGDTSSYLLNKNQLNEKKVRDANAARELTAEFRDCPELVAKFLDYEDKISPEAVFVYWVDKLMPLFNKYNPAGREHFFAPTDEIYATENCERGGNNGSRATVRAWFDNTRDKLCRGARTPPAICEDLLREEFEWLNWLVDAHERDEV